MNIYENIDNGIYENNMGQFMEDLAVFCEIQDNPRHVLLFELAWDDNHAGCLNDVADRYIRYSSLLSD